MVVPGHVVFLWRIIHQYFTFGFLEHISTFHQQEDGKNPGKIILYSGTKGSWSLFRSVEVFWLYCSAAPPQLVQVCWISLLLQIHTSYFFSSPPKISLSTELRWAGVFHERLALFYAAFLRIFWTTWTSGFSSSHTPPALPPWSWRRGESNFLSWV